MILQLTTRYRSRSNRHLYSELGSEQRFCEPSMVLDQPLVCQVTHQQARIALITSWWSTQSRFPVVLGMLKVHPHLFLINPDLASLPVGHQPLRIPQLITWPISGNLLHHKAFLEMLQNFSSLHGDQRQTKTTIHYVQGGLLGLTKIPLNNP